VRSTTNVRSCRASSRTTAKVRVAAEITPLALSSAGLRTFNGNRGGPFGQVRLGSGTAAYAACLQGMGRGPETRIKRPARRIRDIHQGGLSFDRERTTTLCAGERLCRFVTSWENPSVSARVSLVPIAPLGRRRPRDGQDRQHQAEHRGRRFLIEYETLSLA
jgi:hypothetical protein